MIRKSYCHDDVVFNYFNAVGKERNIYRKGTNVFYDDTRLYSWGTHYILAVKCRNGYLLNNTYFSGSTYGHHWLAWRYAREAKVQHVDVPFDLLEKFLFRADSVFEGIRIVDFSDENHKYLVLLDIGRVKVLCGCDESCRNWSKRHFAAQVPYRITSVDEAWKQLCRYLDLDSCQYIGEIILEPCIEIDTRSLTRKADKVLVPLPGIDRIEEASYGKINVLKNFIEVDEKGKIKFHSHGVNGYSLYDQTDVYWHDNKPYLVLFDSMHAGMKIPEDAVFVNESLKVHTKLVKHYEFGADGIKSKHLFTARDAVLVNNRDMFVRGTVRCDNHSMARLGSLWHKVYFWDSLKVEFET